MRYSPIAALAACAFASGCAVPPAQPPAAPEPSNQAISAALTCAQFLVLLRADDRRPAGFAMIWLEGYYAGHANISGIPDGWMKTISQGIGGTCAITANASRTVLDVIAQLHRDYAAAAGVR